MYVHRVYVRNWSCRLLMPTMVPRGDHLMVLSKTLKTYEQTYACVRTRTRTRIPAHARAHARAHALAAGQSRQSMGGVVSCSLRANDVEKRL